MKCVQEKNLPHPVVDVYSGLIIVKIQQLKSRVLKLVDVIRVQWFWIEIISRENPEKNQDKSVFEFPIAVQKLYLIETSASKGSYLLAKLS